MSKICTKCGNVLSDDAQVCTRCGKSFSTSMNRQAGQPMANHQINSSRQQSATPQWNSQSQGMNSQWNNQSQSVNPQWDNQGTGANLKNKVRQQAKKLSSRNKKRGYLSESVLLRF